MVSWFNLQQLAHTGVQVAISSAIGTRVDVRALEGLFDDAQILEHVYEGNAEGELWFDYAADVGDGFRSTYLMAHTMAREALQVTQLSDGIRPLQHKVLPRGRFLILGGDQVYPIAGREQYRERLLDPYQEAWNQAVGEVWKPGIPPRADVEIFAIPGNHDWYDGLVSFRRLFCQDPSLRQRYVGDWKASQGRSYFALELPHRIWLWGVDIQLESDIDESQLRYFRSKASALKTGDRVILCTAEPHWVEDPNDDERERNLFLMKQFIEESGAVLVLSLAGDLHHYRHHELEAKDGDVVRHCIISGGGGAFLHPTHNTLGCEGHRDAPEGNLKLPEGDYKLKAAFPSAQESRALTWQNLKFPFLNVGVSGVLALLHLAYAMGFPQANGDQAVDAWEALISSPGTYLSGVDPASWLLMLGFPILARAVAHGQNPQNRALTALGLAHGILQLAIGVSLFFLFSHGACLLWGVEAANSLGPGILRMILYLGTMFLVAGELLGLYFIVALNGLGEHGNEAFSSISVEHYKNFLRFQIAADGTLWIHPIGIKTMTDDPNQAELILLESPIEIPPIPVRSQATAE